MKGAIKILTVAIEIGHSRSILHWRNLLRLQWREKLDYVTARGLPQVQRAYVGLLDVGQGSQVGRIKPGVDSATPLVS